MIQTKKIKPFPVFLINSAYWKPMVDWMKSTLLGTHKIEADDMDIITLVERPRPVDQGTYPARDHLKSLSPPCHPCKCEQFVHNIRQSLTIAVPKR